MTLKDHPPIKFITLLQENKPDKFPNPHKKNLTKLLLVLNLPSKPGQMYPFQSDKDICSITLNMLEMKLKLWLDLSMKIMEKLLLMEKETYSEDKKLLRCLALFLTLCREEPYQTLQLTSILTLTESQSVSVQELLHSTSQLCVLYGCSPSPLLAEIPTS